MVCNGLAVSIGSDCYVHRKDKYLDIFSADLTDYRAELTGAKGLSTKDNMLDLFEILRGHYSPAGKSKRIPLFYCCCFLVDRADPHNIP